MADPSPEQRELTLIEKVDFRIVNAANNEKKLQDLLKTYLVPLLVKAKSEHASVRNKIVQVCQRITLFIKPEAIVLPVAALLEQFKTNPDSSLLRHYDLLFINHSLAKLPIAERRQLVPKVLKGIGNDRGRGVDSLFNIFLRLLPDVKLPPRGSKEDESFRVDIGLDEPTDAKFVADWLGKLFMLAGTVEQSASRGLEGSEFNFLTLSKPDTWSKSGQGLGLAETRQKAVRFLESGAFTDRERFLPAVYASCHAESTVSSTGNDMLKRTTVSMEDESIVRELFGAHDARGRPYRARILRLLSASRFAATQNTSIMHVFEQNYHELPGSGTLKPEPLFENDLITDGDDNEADRMDTDPPGVDATGISLVVADNFKALFTFINWVVRISPKDGLESRTVTYMVQHLVALMKQIQGWPDPTRQTAEHVVLRCRAYETIGILLGTGALSSTEMHGMLMWLLESLCKDPTLDAVVNIDGALSTVSSLYRPREGSDIQELAEGLRLRMEMREEDSARNIRHAITKIANRCLPFSNIDARWIDILAIAGRPNERSDVVEEGRKGLDPWTYSRENDKMRTLPDWKLMTLQYFRGACARLFVRGPSNPDPSFKWNQDGSGMDVVDEDEGKDILATDRLNIETAGALPVALTYCKTILYLTALPEFRLDPGWERQIEVLVKSDKTTRETIRSYLADPEHGDAVLTLLRACLKGIMDDSVLVAEPCGQAFIEIVSLVPTNVVGKVAGRAADVYPLLRSSRRHLQTLAAKIYGVLGANPAYSGELAAKSMADIAEVGKNIKTATGPNLSQLEGTFLGAAHLMSRQVYYGTATRSGADEGVLQAVPSIADIPPSALEFVIDAYIQLWTAGIPAFGQPTDKTETNTLLIKAFVDPLTTQAKKGKEKAITALGRLAIVPDGGSAGQDGQGDELVDIILSKLYELYDIKQAEVHFAVGEAIAAAVACWDSDAVELTLDVQPKDDSYRIGKRPAKLQQVLEKLLVDSKTTKPSLLKATGIWLFCIIQHCSHLPEVQSRLRECQVAFMRLVSARDELVQETASRGLSLVYEKGDASLKDALVKDLVQSFTGSGPQIKVDEETELFEAGALPTGDGKSITSYKDIVSLANEVGDQTLVYKFMSLANNAATWSARSAFGRFGLSNILSESEVDPKLYPKLFRYRFDPNPNVQKSMDDIWKALVKDSNAVLETHFDAIIQDLLKSVLGREWRVRQASCAAISDLIQGRPFPSYERYYQDIWIAALKVLDDVKNTVREAALKLCITLSNTLVRQVEESGSTSSAIAMMNEALPFLLSDKGVESSVKDVRLFATITVMKLAKSGGKALKPFITTMVTSLLGLLSTIEPDEVNYYYLRAGEDNREKIDKLRSAMVSQSPLSEAIENCLPNIDRDVMNDLAPVLEATIKSAVGMPSKIGCGRVLVTLASRHAEDFRPFSARFLHIMEKQTLDRNDEVSRGYAAATAYILRIAPEAAKSRFAEQTINLYFKSEDERRRQKVAEVVLALSKISPDHFNALEASLLPFAFLGKHDTNDVVQGVFEEVWSKHAGTSLTVTRYIPEILGLAKRSLDTAQWDIKHGGALATASLVLSVTSASTVSGHVNVDNLKAVWPVFEKSLALKTFTGKEKLLEALRDFVTKGKALWEKDASLAGQLRKIAVREAKRNNEAYRPHAFRCLWKVAAAREDIDMLDEISGVVGSFISEFQEEVGKKSGGNNSDRARQAAAERGEDVRSKTAWAAIEALVKGYNRPNMHRSPFAVLSGIISAMQKHASPDASASTDNPAANAVLARPPFEAIRRAYWYGCAAELLKDSTKNVGASDASTTTGAQRIAVLRWLAATLDMESTQTGSEQHRLARAKAARALLHLWKKRAVGVGDTGEQTEAEAFGEQMTALVVRAGAEERSLECQKRWKACLGILSGDAYASDDGS